MQKLISILVVITTMISCEQVQEEVSPIVSSPKNQTPNESVRKISPQEWNAKYLAIPNENGVLALDSAGQLYDLIDQYELFELAERSVATVRKDFPSFYTAYNKLIAELEVAGENDDREKYLGIIAQNPSIIFQDERESVKPTIGFRHQIISPFLNEKGMVKLGDYYHIYNRFGIFSSTKNSEALLRASMTLKPSEGVSVFVYPVSTSTMRSVPCNPDPNSGLVEYSREKENTSNNRLVELHIDCTHLRAQQSPGIYSVRSSVIWTSVSYKTSPWKYRYSTNHKVDYAITSRTERRSYENAQWESHSFARETTPTEVQEFPHEERMASSAVNVLDHETVLFIPELTWADCRASHKGMDASNPSNWAILDCSDF